MFEHYTISGKGERDSGIRITGTGTIVGKTKNVLSIQVEIDGLGIRIPGAEVGGGRIEAGDEASLEAKEPSTS